MSTNGFFGSLMFYWTNERIQMKNEWTNEHEHEKPFVFIYLFGKTLTNQESIGVHSIRLQS